MRNIYKFAALIMCLLITTTFSANAQINLAGRFKDSTLVAYPLGTTDTSSYMQFDSTFTIEVWVKFDNAYLTTKQTIFSYAPNGTPIAPTSYDPADVTVEAINISNVGGHIIADFGGSRTLQYMLPSSYNNIWMHISLVRDRSGAITLYSGGMFKDSINDIMRTIGRKTTKSFIYEIGGRYSYRYSTSSAGYTLDMRDNLVGYISELAISNYAKNNDTCLITNVGTVLYMNMNSVSNFCTVGSSYTTANMRNIPIFSYSIYDTVHIVSTTPVCDTLTSTDTSHLSVANTTVPTISIYPNPAYDKIVISTSNHNPTEAIITDMTGRIVKYLTITNSIELNDIIAGSYILTMQNQHILFIKQ